MCGRFAFDYPQRSLLSWYNAISLPDLSPRYNIAPTTDILVIRDTSDGRKGSLMRWGLIPHWAKDIKKIPLFNNARAETVASKLLFRNAFRKQRCIIPASGFYEWKLLNDRKHKQPYFISRIDNNPMSFAGIWESATVNEIKIESCSIITTKCNDLMRPIHDRMPMILPNDLLDVWLKPAQLPDEILIPLLKPFDSTKIQAWPVSSNVNRVTIQSALLTLPVEPVY